MQLEAFINDKMILQFHFNTFVSLFKSFMSRVVREELKEMEMDIELQEKIYAEIEEEILQW